MRSVAVLGSLLALVVAGVASARTNHPAAAKATVITVTAGKPSEFAFTLSKSSKVPSGSVTFNVTNKGAVPHDFEICLTAAKAATANSCKGKVTPMLAKGKSASITVTLSKSGTYEFLCTVPGHAAAGMKGLLGIGVSAAAAGSATGLPSGSTSSGSTSSGSTSSGSTTSTSSGSTASAPTAPTSFPAGNATNGKSIFTGAGGCGGCHALAAAGTPAGDGPALDGTKLSVSTVESIVSTGGGGMPNFGTTLSAQQIADVATFVSQSSQ